MDMWKTSAKGGGKFAKTEKAVAESSASAVPGIVPNMSDFDHPMPRLMDYFRGKSMLDEVESAHEKGGGAEED